MKISKQRALCPYFATSRTSSWIHNIEYRFKNHDFTLALMGQKIVSLKNLLKEGPEKVA